MFAVVVRGVKGEPLAWMYENITEFGRNIGIA